MPIPNQDTFKRTSPEAQGVSSSAILKFLEAVEDSKQELHSFMFLRNGCVFAEGWWSPYAPDLAHRMFSLSKSFLSTAVGLAVGENFFSIEESVISFFPDETSHLNRDEWANLRVKHLLSMATGQIEKPFPFMYGQKDGNWVKGFFDVPMVHTPGSYFLYNTGASYLLSEIVQRTTGMNLMDFLSPRLFEPLGITGATWEMSPTGVCLGGIGLNIKTEDIARFGQLYLQKGIWQGQRILSETWIQEASAAQIANGNTPNSDWTQGYGYQFWRCQHGFYRGDGSFGQFCIIMEKYNAVLALTAAATDMQVIMNLLWDKLVPAMQAAPLLENPPNYEKLLDKISNLRLSPVAGQAKTPIAAQISAKQFIAENNRLGIKSLSLEFADSTCTLRLRTDAKEENIIATFGSWQRGQAAFFDEIWLTGEQALLASGAWLDDKHYLIQVRLINTPYCYKLHFAFDGATLTFSIQINVSLISSDATIIRARIF